MVINTSIALTAGHLNLILDSVTFCQTNSLSDHTKQKKVGSRKDRIKEDLVIEDAFSNRILP